MPWIELHQSLPTHRKTLDMADELDIAPVTAVGHLCCLWLWAIDNAPEGNISGIKPRTVARAAHWEGDADTFIAALTHAGFLNGDGAIHDWHDYAGRLVERRRANAERMRRVRSGTRAEHDSSISNGRAAHVQRTLRARAERQDLTGPDQTSSLLECESEPLPPVDEGRGTGAGAGAREAHSRTPGREVDDTPRQERHPAGSPAVRVYGQATGIVPAAVLRARIDGAVSSSEEEALALWGRVVVTWLERGYKPQNLAGMLEWFAAGGPPETGPPARAGPAQRRNGRPSPNDLIADRLRAIREAQGANNDDGSTSGSGAMALDVRAVPGGHGPTTPRLPPPRRE